MEFNVKKDKPEVTGMSKDDFDFAYQFSKDTKMKNGQLTQ